MTVFDDLAAEQDRLDAILSGLSDGQWATPSLAAGWTVRDVMVHLAQTEEMALARLGGARNPAADPASSPTASPAADPAAAVDRTGRTVGDIMAALVEADPAPAAEALRRWQQARGPALERLRAADPEERIEWAAAPLRPAALATTRLAEQWTHGLDITGPLGLEFPDTGRLRHVAWLAHRMLPYSFGLAGQPAVPVRAELTAPNGTDIWEFGPPAAPAAPAVITGAAGAFCRVAAQRLAPDQSGLRVSGPDGARALAVVRTYAA
jgi:uncharacterized protein (TIGR03084 family)